MTMQIRTLTPADIGAVLHIQSCCYGAEYQESDAAFLGKCDAFPRGAIGAFADGELVAYVFCLPAMLGETVPLNRAAHDVSKRHDCLYIHDLAVLPRMRGADCGRALLEQVRRLAADEGLHAFALVAVQQAAGYWRRWGFVERREVAYGAQQAAYMEAIEGMRWT